MIAQAGETAIARGVVQSAILHPSRTRTGADIVLSGGNDEKTLRMISRLMAELRLSGARKISTEVYATAPPECRRNQPASRRDREIAQ